MKCADAKMRRCECAKMRWDEIRSSSPTTNTCDKACDDKAPSETTVCCSCRTYVSSTSPHNMPSTWGCHAQGGWRHITLRFDDYLNQPLKKINDPMAILTMEVPLTMSHCGSWRRMYPIWQWGRLLICTHRLPLLSALVRRLGRSELLKRDLTVDK